MELINHLIFEIESGKYAIPAHRIMEIIPLPELTPAEEFPDQIRGIFDLRGRFVVVTDPAFGLTGKHHRCQTTDKIIVLEGNGYAPGLLVSEVFDVTGITTDEITPVNEVYPEAGAMNVRFVSGVVSTDDGIIFILDLETTLSPVLFEEAVNDAGQESGNTPCESSGRYFAPGASESEKAIFRERALALHVKNSDEEFSERDSYSVFILDGELFGMKTKHVAGFHDIRSYTPVPCCPPHIIGQTNFHGTIITLVDISPVVKTSGSGRNKIQKIIILETSQGKAAIRVDEVEDVIYLREKDIVPLPSASRFVDESFQSGAAYYNNRMLTLIDIENILLHGGLVVDEEF